MRIRRYFAPDMRTALAKAREEQGADVMILSNRSVDGGVELVTTDAGEAAAGHTAAVSGVGGREGTVSESLWTREPMLEAMRAELAGLRRLVETQISGLAWGDLGRHHPVRAQLMRRLVALGFDPRLASATVAELPHELDQEQGWRRALALLARRLVPGHDRILAGGGRYALVGPTGVGKTTVIAKLAARAVLRQGADAVAIITADDRRIGAHEQLKCYGRVLGVSVWSANDADEVRRALDAAADRRVVLIDTPGTASVGAEVEHLAQLLSGGIGINVVSVIAAVTQGSALANALKACAALAPVGCVITKIDECVRLGAALGAVIDARLPLLYTTSGQRVPEDIETSSAAQLIARAVSLAGHDSGGVDDVALEGAFAQGDARAYH